MNIPDWLIDPFLHLDTAGSSNLKEELINNKQGGTTNEELQIQFKMGYKKFWLQKTISVLLPWIIENNTAVPS